MACDRWLEAISAAADGEDGGIEPQLLERHLQNCAACRAFRDDLHVTRGAMRVAAADPVPDLSAQVTKANAVADRASRWALIRFMLGLVAAQIVILALPALVFGDEPGTSPHGGRHLGAFSLAYAVGLCVVVVRPARARTMLPVAQVLCGAIVLSTLVDVLEGSVGASGEVVHLPELISVVLLWALAVNPRSDRAGATRRSRLLRLLPRRKSRSAA